MVARHGAALLRVANQFSLCHDDALDAYQRALEIYLRRLETVDPATEGAWLRVVVKHEAMAIRARGRSRSTPRTSISTRASTAACARSRTTVAGGERVDRSVEALKALKPDEAAALLLKAEGLSYDEIGKPFRLVLHEGQSLDRRGPHALPEGVQRDRGRRGVRAPRGGARRARGRDGDERPDALDPPAPAPLRVLPGDRARDALLAHAADRAARCRSAWLSRLLSRAGRHDAGTRPPTAAADSVPPRRCSGCA